MKTCLSPFVKMLCPWFHQVIIELIPEERTFHQDLGCLGKAELGDNKNEKKTKTIENGEKTQPLQGKAEGDQGNGEEQCIWWQAEEEE